MTFNNPVKLSGRGPRAARGSWTVFRGPIRRVSRSTNLGKGEKDPVKGGERFHLFLDFGFVEIPPNCLELCSREYSSDDRDLSLSGNVKIVPRTVSQPQSGLYDAVNTTCISYEIRRAMRNESDYELLKYQIFRAGSNEARHEIFQRLMPFIGARVF